MHKKCKEILEKLEKEKKIKVWWEFKFPEKEELKIKLKDILEEEVEEKYYLSEKQIEQIKYRGTLIERDSKEPKCIEVGKLDIKGHDSIKRVYSEEGISPALTSMQGGNRQPKILIKNATKKGYIEAEEGDSVNLSYPESETRRGRVGFQVSQTIQCNDNIGVVVNERKQIICSSDERKI